MTLVEQFRAVAHEVEYLEELEELLVVPGFPPRHQTDWCDSYDEAVAAGEEQLATGGWVAFTVEKVFRKP